MSVFNYIIIGYFFVGIILAYIWWKDEYEAEYEIAKEDGELEKPIVILFIAALVFFWPFKAIKNYFESFFD
jgi:hypothetical protein